MPTPTPLQTRGSSGSSLRPLSRAAKGEPGLSPAPAALCPTAGSTQPCTGFASHTKDGVHRPMELKCVSLLFPFERERLVRISELGFRKPDGSLGGLLADSQRLGTDVAWAEPLSCPVVPCRAWRVSPQPPEALAKAVLSRTEGFHSGHPPSRGEVTWVPLNGGPPGHCVSKPRTFLL